MSKAFTKEDVDPPERTGRVRSASGLPPGAVNYITTQGAERLRVELASLRRDKGDANRISELERILASVTIVGLPGAPSDTVEFGAAVTLQNATGKRVSFRIVGTDELDLVPDGVSWLSPIGKTLLASRLNDRVSLDGEKSGRIVKIEYPLN